MAAVVNMSHQTNGPAPFHQQSLTAISKLQTSSSSSSNIKATEEKEEAEETQIPKRRNPKVIKSIQSSGPLGLFVFLTAYIFTTYLWYHINIDPPLSNETPSSRLFRWNINVFVIAPWNLLSILFCVVSFGTILDSNDRGHAIGIARAGLGGLIGALVVFVMGFEVGVFEGEVLVHEVFWALTGVVPGAGVVALLGVLWDFCRDGREEGDEEEKKPLLEVEEV